MTRQKSAEPTSARHRTDYLSLIFGLLFLAVAGWWAASYYLDWVITVHLPDAGWVLAAGLILLGLIGLVASLRRDGRTVEPTPASSQPVAGPGPAPTVARGGAAGPAQPDITQPARMDDPTAGGPLAGERSAEADRRAADGGAADRDRPTAGDPGGHRPE